mmetsp:Transcript_97210/g.264027  ORF Transcript_97210/g.264027 Transcript_97210/m.264027 type:complete len:275 (-) Transcript_97210:204-1028(-)
MPGRQDGEARRRQRRRQRGALPSDRVADLPAGEVEAGQPRRERAQRGLGAQQPLPQGDGLAEGPVAQVSPPHGVPQQLVVFSGARRGARRGGCPGAGRRRLAVLLDHGGERGAVGVAVAVGPHLHLLGWQLQALRDELEDHVLARGQEVVGLQDLNQNARGKPEHRSLHVRVREEWLELLYDERDRPVADAPQGGAVVRAGDVESAMLLQQQRRRLGEGHLDPAAHGLEEPTDPEDVGDLQQQQGLGGRGLEASLVLGVYEVQGVLERRVARLR